ncbi:MAG: beta-N-acetylhexosaminidase [Desulfobacterales bacterium]|jgi:beta-N-acetylhexosaminidase|nr:beta-N-acetylhexosaminidase [Desulfobacterales bacterium]
MSPETLSIEQLAGQRLMVGFEGKQFNAHLKFLIRDLKVGGIILFSQNVETPDQVKNLCDAVQEYAQLIGQPPLMIAIDQEGGQVARLKEPFTQFPGNSAMTDVADAVYFAQTTATELAQAGINMNLAPVMDVASEEITSIMAARSFGQDPFWVSKLGLTIISHLQQNNIMAVAKHFPGIGRTVADSHIDLPSCECDLAELESCDLIPFSDSIEQEVAGIMLSHVIYKKIDPRWPASLSQRIALKLLRERMRFSGISMTDDLDMGAINKHYDIKTAIRQILQADIDMTLICHQGPNIEIAYKNILKHLRGSPEIEAMGIESVKRIMALKEKYLGA